MIDFQTAVVVFLVIGYVYLALWVFILNRVQTKLIEIVKETIDVQDVDIQNMKQIRLALAEMQKVESVALRNKFLTTFYGSNV